MVKWWVTYTEDNRTLSETFKRREDAEDYAERLRENSHATGIDVYYTVPRVVANLKTNYLGIKSELKKQDMAQRNNNQKRNSNNNQKQDFGARRTGCVKRTYKNTDGEVRDMIRAWRPDPYTRQGWQSAIAVPLNNPDPENGNTTHQKWVVTISDSMGKRKFNGLYNISKGIVSIPDLNLVMSPNGKGSFGHPSKR